MKCIGEFGGKCQNDATRSVDMTTEVFHLCEKCYQRFDKISRRRTGKLLKEIAALQKRSLS